MSEYGAPQRTNAPNIGKANIGDRIAFTTRTKTTFRGGAHTQSACGILTAIQIFERLGVIRATVDGEIYTLGAHVVVEVKRAPGAPPLELPAPQRQSTRTYTKSTERMRSDTAAELFGVTTTRPADSLSSAHVGQEIALRIDGNDITGVITSVARGFGDMADIGVDGQSFVLPGDKNVSVTKRRMSAAS